ISKDGSHRANAGPGSVPLHARIHARTTSTFSRDTAVQYPVAHRAERDFSLLWGFHLQMKRSEPAHAVIQFAVTGTLALLLLGFLAVTLLRNTGKSEAIRDARQTTRLAGEGVVAPAITPALERGDPRAIAAMDRLLG